jgi:prolyl oligopeptidase
MNDHHKSPLLNSSAPPRARTATVVDEYHGQQIADPYRWLEDAAAPETRQFVAAQNAYTRAVLENFPRRDELRRNVEQLLTIGRVASPRIGGNKYFYERRDGRQNQAVVYVREGDQGKDRALIDVNVLAPDGTIALDWWYPSEDGRYVAFGTSPNGSELSTLQVIETDTGKLLPEKIERTRAASVAWLPDSSGFYYTRYPRPDDVPAGEEMYNRRVFFHELSSSGNTGGAQDPLIFPADDIELAPQHWPNVSLSNDGRWLLVDVNEGWTKTELYLKELSFKDLSSREPAVPENRFQRITMVKYWTASSTSPAMKVRRVSESSRPRAPRPSAGTGKKSFRNRTP